MEFTHNDFGDGRLSYTLNLRSYRSEDSCKALSLYSANLLISVYKLLNGNRFIRAEQEEDGFDPEELNEHPQIRRDDQVFDDIWIPL